MLPSCGRNRNFGLSHFVLNLLLSAGLTFYATQNFQNAGSKEIWVREDIWK